MAEKEQGGPDAEQSVDEEAGEVSGRPKGRQGNTDIDLKDVEMDALREANDIIVRKAAER